MLTFEWPTLLVAPMVCRFGLVNFINFKSKLVFHQQCLLADMDYHVSKSIDLTYIKCSVRMKRKFSHSAGYCLNIVELGWHLL